MVKFRRDADYAVLTLRPNRSASWREIKWVIAGMTVFVMLVALAWAWVGVWVILPFAGLEVSLLALMMYLVNLKCHAKQIISIGKGEIIIECGIKQPVFRWQFDRQASHLTVVEAKTSFERAQLVLTDENISIQIGDFLNQQDCKLARRYLHQAGLIEISNHWWKRQAW